MRDNTSWMWLCSAWFEHNGHPVFFVSKSYEPELFRKDGKMMTRRVRMFSQKIASAYDTFERLTVAEHAQSKDDLYANASAAAGGRGRKGSASVLDAAAA